MKENKLLIVTIIIGIMNWIICFVSYNLLNGNDFFSPFVLAIQRKIEIYFIFLSGGVSVVFSLVAIIELCRKKKKLLVISSIVINVVYVIYYWSTVGSFFLYNIKNMQYL